jgi:hypothetical protein
MTMPSQNLSAESFGEERVEISFPAAADLVVLARFTAATVGARAGFDVDEIEDLRLAVDELCVSLGPQYDDDCLRIVFARSNESVTIEASFASSHRPGDRRSMARTTIWEQSSELSAQLLDSLVDDHGFQILEGQRRTWLRKQRSAGIQ